MLNYNDNTKRCIVCHTKHTWFDLILDSFNSMIRPVSKCLFFLLRGAHCFLRMHCICEWHVSHPTHDAMRPIFPAIVLPVACKYTPLSSIPTARRLSSFFSKWQLVPKGDCLRSYAMVIEQCRRQWPQLFSQRDKKGPLDQKKHQALRNRIAYVHDQILYIFLRFKTEVSQSLFDRIVKISNKNYKTRKCWIMVIKLLQNQWNGTVWKLRWRTQKLAAPRDTNPILAKECHSFFYWYKLDSTLLHSN